MDSDRLNKWLTLGANIGVLIGIILLIAELNQNYEITRAQTRTDLSQSLLDLLALTASNRDLAEISIKANNSEELSAAEERMFRVWSESVFSYWQNVHYQGRHGMYEMEEFSKHLLAMEDLLNSEPALVQYWCGARNHFPEVFADEINQLIDVDPCKDE